jgi:hypothetical protein
VLWVEAARGPRRAGVGVLVAPDRVLTNDHVVGAASVVSFRGVDGAVGVAAILVRRPGDPGDTTGVITDRSRLDYALLQLAAPLPAPCSAARGRVEAGGPLFVVGWPRDADAPRVWPVVAAGADPTGTRVWYRGDVPRGASGALVIDGAGHPVAIHHARLRDGRWQGVSMAAIDADLALRGP